MVEQRWRKLHGAHQLPLVRVGVRFADGVQVERENAKRKTARLCEANPQLLSIRLRLVDTAQRFLESGRVPAQRLHSRFPKYRKRNSEPARERAKLETNRKYSLVIVLAFVLPLLFFAPLEIYLNNIYEFSARFWHLVPLFLGVSTVLIAAVDIRKIQKGHRVREHIHCALENHIIFKKA